MSARPVRHRPPRRWVAPRSSVRGASLVAVLALAASLVGVGAALADEGDPTRADVRRAEAAVDARARDVAAVEADLAAANVRLRQVAIRAGQAAEAYNGARYRAQLARQAARVATRQARVAQADVSRQQDAYGSALAATYQLSPELSAVSAIISADGISSVLEKTNTLRNAETAMNEQWDRFRASSTLAEVTADQAATARAEADQARVDARAARDAAAAAAAAAQSQAEAIADQKGQLIAELAEAQDVSVATAEAYQAAVEEEQAEQAAEEGADDQDGQDPADNDTQPGDEPSDEPTSEPTQEPTTEPTSEPTDEPTEPVDNDPQEPASGASDAVAFAARQIGEPYRWGAAGPDAWDCSGLTMGAWKAGGVSLPHYSVAQYEQSTPISVGSLKPGDLVFWGSSSKPSSIYHVAIYAGDGMIIHAPRTGRDVTRESMYYWIAPNFYARP